MCLTTLTPLFLALEFQSRSPVKLNQFIFLTFCQQMKYTLFIKGQLKKIISLDPFIQENSESFIQHSSQRLAFYLKMTTLWLMIFFLYLLALPDEWQRIVGHSEDGFRREKLATYTVFLFFFFWSSKRTFLRGNVIGFIWVKWNRLCGRLLLCSLNG